ncbi:Hsp20 family protein [Flavobacterium sp. Sd200]|uniref:Hsp20/alpha crystallin family protein n=1 Tax=Flavobacterium sp. Sd200 TaxID=2692211 RepID=UPI001368B531|nr:Hsp20/alpha crystallin family protein [Flavobacterium sp. Sd200]MXN91801.1 Hsp20 family protein [Flavobacterium sp. Sd200]
MNLVKRNYSNGYLVMDQFFKDILGGTQYAHKTVPPVNVKESEGFFNVALVAPGLKKEDFNIEVDNGLLTISYKAEAEKTEEQEGKYTRKEFTQTSFKRAFTLPENISEESINAAYTDGILNITLPKKEEAEKPAKRVIEIL